MISDKYKCIFVHIPKCGGSSIEDAIWLPEEKSPENLFMGFVDTYHNPYQTGGLQHLKALQIRQHVGRNKFNEYFKFSIVRNPFDKAVSQFKFMQKRPDLREFIGLSENDGFLVYLEKIRKRTHIQWETQVSFIFDYAGRQLVDYVGRFENIDSAFSEISRHIGLDVQLPHTNASPDKSSWRSFYCKTAREIIEDMYDDDLEAFGYTFDA